MRVIHFLIALVLTLLVDPLTNAFRAAMRHATPRYAALPRLVRFVQHPFQKRGRSKTVAGGSGWRSFLSLAFSRPVLTAAVIAALVIGSAALGHDYAGMLFAGAGGTTTEEVKTLIENIGRNFEAFRAANDREIAEIKQNGQASAETKQEVTRLNNSISEMQAQLREVENAVARSRFGSDGKEVDAKALENARQFVAVATGRRVADVRDSDIDMKAIAEYRHAVDAYLRTNQIQDALQVGVSPDGGYWVSPDTSGRIVEMIYQTNPLRKYADVVSTTKDAKEGWTDLDEMGSPTKKSEGGSAPENTDTPDLGKWRIPVHEVAAEPRATQQMLDDEDRNMEEWLLNKGGRRFTRWENDKFVNGSGVGEARGFIGGYTPHASAPTKAAWQRIQFIKTGVNGDFPAVANHPGDKIIDLIHLMKREYRQGAIFAGSNTTIGGLRKLKDSDGNYLLLPDFRDGFAFRLQGHLVEEFPEMPDYTTTGAYALAFANFKEGYTIVDRLGIRVLRDPFTKKGWIKFYMTRRVGGDVTNFEAIKLLQFSA